jgi:hypothetical protein
MTDEDEDAIFEACASGRSAREVAKTFNVSVKQVHDIVEAKVNELHSGEGLRKSVGFALFRLEKMELKFHNRAMEGDGDTTAAMVAVKCNERRSTLSGSNAEIGHAVRLITGAGPEPLTSTQSLLLAFDEVRHVTPRQRQLLDRQDNLTDDEQAELAKLEAESARKRAEKAKG